MLELLVTEADLNIGLQKAKTELDDFLVSSKESLVHGQKESAVDVLVNECLDTFVSSYYALSDALKRSTYLKKESRRDEVIWNFSLSYASTAVLNLIERKMGRDLDISHSDLGSLAPINPDDLKGKGQYSMLSASMVGLRSYVLASGQGGNIVYKLAHFFNGLESLATNEAGLACSDEGLEKELNKIKPRTNAYGLSFREKVRTRKGRTRTNGNGNGSKELLADQMPDALPDYEATKVRLEHVVGNTEVIDTLMDYVICLLHFDVKAQENHLWMDGNGFPEGVLLYGPPGVGKTYTVKAILNHFLEMAQAKGLPAQAVALDGHNINSVYQNRAGTLLEHYFGMIRKGDRIRAVMLDEFDDLIPMGSDGNLSENARQRLSAFKRSTGNSDSLGNALLFAIANRISKKKDIPTEVTDRFIPLYVPGPQTPGEYGRIIRLGLQVKESKGLVDPNISWENVGSYVMSWKEKLEQYDDSDICIGRGYKIITQQLAATTKRPKIEYADHTLGKPASYHAQFYKDEWLPVDEKNLIQAIDKAMNLLIHSKTKNQPGRYI